MKILRSPDGADSGPEITIVQTPAPTPPAKEAPTPAVATPVKLTDEELESRRKEMLSVHFGNGAKPPTKPDAPAKPEEPAAKVEPDPPAAPPAKPEPRRRPTTAEIASAAAATGASKAIEAMLSQQQERQPAPKPDAPVVNAAELSTDDKADLEAIQFMEQADQKNAGLAVKFADFARKTYDYRSKWQKDNPGREFEPNDDDHEEFYAGQPVAFEAVQAAREQLKEHRIIEKAAAPLRQEMSELKRSLAEEKETPRIRAVAFDGIRQLIEGASEEAKGIMIKDGNLDLSKANIERLKTEEPYIHGVLDSASRELTPIIEEIERVWNSPVRKPWDPARNPVHAQINRIAGESEALLLDQSTPPEQRVRDGKTFISGAEWNNRLAAAKTAEAQSAIRRAYWTFDGHDIRRLAIGRTIGAAKEKIEEFNNALNSRMKRGSAASTHGTAPATPASIPAKPAEQRRTTAAPSISSGSDTLTNAGISGAAPKNFGEQAASVLFS